jgi:hypothetical protein
MSTKRTRRNKIISLFLLLIFLQSVILPTAALALTGGPSQPEVESFAPVGMTEMVDLFSGDFKYNIPLMDAGGYPINLSYNAGPNMEQEASWVGLGWNLNPGAINRNLRGLPDDSYGEKIENKIYQKPNWSFSLGSSDLFKAFGVKVLNTSLSLGLNYNNYTGLGLDLSMHLKPNSKKKDAPVLDNPQPTSNEKLPEFTYNSFCEVKNSSINTNITKNIYPELNRPIREGKLIKTNVRNYLNELNNSRTFAFASYTPSMNFEYSNYDLSLSFPKGLATFGLYGSFPIYGKFSSQNLAKQNFSKKSFGYLYQWENVNQDFADVLLDINRERDGNYFDGKPYLPLPIATYDLYSVSGEGLGGQIKPFRNAVDIYSDDRKTSKSRSGKALIELGIGTDLHNEFNFDVTLSNSESGKWPSNLSNYIENNTLNFNHPEYERTYFKFIGENTPSNQELIFNAKSGLVVPKVERNFLVVNSPAIFNNNGTAVSINSDAFSKVYSEKRTPRKQHVSFLTFENYMSFVNPNIQPVPFHVQTKHSIGESAPSENIIPPHSNFLIEGQAGGTTTSRKLKHIGEFTITKADGNKHVYGITTYNNSQKEVSFTCANEGYINPNNGNRKFKLNKEAGTDFLNTRTEGISGKRSDEFYQSTKTPAYAHSYLLSSILSPDYFDIFPKGIGPEDLGSYVKFEYGMASESYHWRQPYHTDEANFSEGLRSELYDNKASYTEGIKEIWHLQTIRTKKYVVVFYVDKRKDGLDALGSGKSYKLTKISLYEREKYDQSTNPDKLLEPIKSVWFEYDYSLCQGIYNNDSQIDGEKGKLTLKKVYITYGNSLKRFNTYEFNYSNINPTYNPLNVDRWGNYKTTYPSQVTKQEFPYVNQNREEADLLSSAWSISEIKLPSGGKIKINYESDDYGFVQDKRSAQLTKIEGIGSSTNFVNSNVLYNGSNNNNYLYLKIPGTIERRGLTPEQFIEESMQIDNIILFKVFCQITGMKYEWIHGYGVVESYGLCTNNTDYQYFYIKLKERKIQSLVEPNKSVNAIAKSGLRFTKDMLPHVVNPEWADIISEEQPAEVSDLLQKLFALGDISDKLLGPFSNMMVKSFCSKVDLSKSFIRLSNPFKAKLGGGHRVKSLEFSDNWFTMTNQTNNSQKVEQIYSYNLKENFGNTSRTISSGVASYEPSSGFEENPFKLPIDYNRKIGRIFPSENIQEDGPLGESFFPSPSIGYSRVTIETKGYLTNTPNGSNLETIAGEKKSPAKTVNEYYTWKDFPVNVSYSGIDLALVNPPTIDLLVFSTSYRKTAVSQGFCIELNDMHGKPKATYEYSSNEINNQISERLISYTKYYYQTNPNNPTELNNEVKLIMPDKTIKNATIGLENEFIIDNRMKNDNSNQYGLQLNTSTLITCFGITIPSIYPDCGWTTDDFYSSVSLNLRNRNGILKKTEVYQDGATIFTENLAYDGETGEPLVTVTTDEFKANKFNTTIPSHWNGWYDGMGPSYKNYGIQVTNITTNSAGIITSSQIPIDDLLVDGDEVIVSSGNGKYNCYVVKNNSNYFLYHRKLTGADAGIIVPYIGTGFDLRIIKSGRVNMQSVPVQTFTTLNNPLGATSIGFNTESKIVDTKVSTYFDSRPKYRTFSDSENTRDSVHKMVQALNAANFILSSLNFQFSGPRVSPQRYIETFIIPSSILNSTNPYTTSSIYKQRKINGVTQHKVETECLLTSLNDSYRFSFVIKFDLGDGTGIFFENNCTSPTYIYSNLINSILTGFSYDSYSSNVSTNGRLFYTTSANENNVITTTPNHFNLNGHQMNSSLVLVEDDHLHHSVFDQLRFAPNWKPQTSYVFKGDRSYPSGTPIARSGYYSSYNEFNPSSNYQFPGSKWKAAEITTLVDPYTGAELESKDALNRYRTIQYKRGGLEIPYFNNGIKDFAYQLQPSIYSDNARQPQVTYFDFESPNPNYDNTIKNDLHYFTGGIIETVQKHSGLNSLKVTSTSYFSVPICKNYNLNDLVPNSILPFYPDPGKYHFSVWVKVNKPFYSVSTSLPIMRILLHDKDGNLIGSPSEFFPDGAAINGWQKITGIFEIPNSITSLPDVRLRVIFKSGTNGGAWFDDFRIAPLNSMMKTFVYNSKMQTVAALDENNYATFYSYNEKGELISISRETEKGIVTIKESRKLNINQ